MRGSKVRWSMVGLGRVAIAFVALIALVGVALQAKAALPANPSSTSAAAPNQAAGNSNGIVGPIVKHEEKHDLSPRFDSIPPAPAQAKTEVEREQGHKVYKTGVRDIDTVIQSHFGPLAMPTPILTFDGIGAPQSSCSCAPPDTNGEVGPNNYVQTTNSAFAVWDKNGTQTLTPRALNTLWSGFGGACQTHNDGDPVVNYDQLADRWVISQFTSSSPYYQCIAVSQTGDPAGAYYRYAFFESNTILGDYPKVGVWPDAYYMTTNEFSCQTCWEGAGNYAFDRTAMLAGQTATAIYFHLPTSDWGGAQPSDLDGSNLPPAGAPNLFVEADDSAWDPPNIPTDQIQMWRFHVDFATPANATFTALPPFTPSNGLAPFDALLCNFNPCVPQPGTAQKLDTLADRLMFRVAYRNFGDHESIVFNQTVDTGTDKAAIRWYEIRGINSTPTLYQQSTYDPDTDHRWMGSMAMDGDGNAAIGFSVSNGTSLYPSIRYAGRLSTDPLNQLAQGEATMFNGTGSQTTPGRWGDYSDLTVDPVDDCTFWYTTEYYATNSAYNWRTRIGKFKFPGCGTGPTPTPTSQVTNTPTPTNTPQSVATNTPISTNTPGGPTNTPTNTPQPGATNTPGTPQATATVCPITFTDVQPGSTFYDFVRCLACRGIINGYSDGTFKPNNQVTRGQLSKIVSNSAGFSDPQATQMFQDVPVGSTFFAYIGRLASRGYIGGYACGGPGEPCVPPDNLPYFRPNANATRGQISKIVSNAAGFQDPIPTGQQTFQDVAPGSTFYDFVERLASRGVMGGYTCGGAGEPCIPPENRPYFRPNNNATRGQTSKIVANTFFPNCDTPSGR